jgi:cell division protein ZapA
MIDMAAVRGETINVNVQIAERSYPLKVLKGDEEKVQSAVRKVNDKIKEYQVMFAGKDKQDYLAMCLLNLAVEQENLHAAALANDSLLEEKIKELEKVLTGISL